MMQTHTKMIYGSSHQGGALQHMVKNYPTVQAVAGELIQNSIDVEDGGATKITLEINYDIGTINYFDNGMGITPETFEKAVGTFGHSIKSGDKYGKFGIGLASPLSIAEEFHFITACSGARYLDYGFNRETLFAVVSGGYPIPMNVRPDLAHGDGKTPGMKPRNQSNVWWRSSVQMTGVTTDKQKRRFDMEAFQADIQSAYGPRLVELGTKITIKLTQDGKSSEIVFKAKLYEGRKLAEWSADVDGVGRVTVNFHLAPIGYAGKPRIDVGPGDNPSRIPFIQLRLAPAYEALDEKVRAALNSKLFQGEIIGEHLQLHTSRKSFVDGDSMLGLVVALEQWYKEVGRMYHEDQSRERKANRYQSLGLEILERMKALSSDPQSPFASVFAKVEYGSIGKEHFPVPKKTIVGGEVIGKAVVGEKLNFDGETPPRGDPKGQKTGHKPEVSIGPEGQKRQVVQGHSGGLHIVWDPPFDLGSRMWHYNPSAACLTINISHPAFALIEKSDAQVKQYGFMLFLMALRIELELDQRQKELQRNFAEESVQDWVKYLLSNR